MRTSLGLAVLCAIAVGCGTGGATTGGPMSADAAADGTADATNASAQSDATSPSDAAADASNQSANDAGAVTDALTDAIGDSGAASCKRGIATNAAPSSAFAPTSASPGVTWWYDWSNQAPAATAGIEFVPMIWGSGALGGPVPAGVRFLLGFNEPNFKSQSNLTPQQAAADWPSVEALAHGAGVPIVSPAVNYCGSASSASNCSDPTVTDPYTYLKDFFAACAGCEVDAIAVHWYNCDLPSLRAYLEGNLDAGGGLQGFVQFGKPIWLTEFSCDGSHTSAQQKAYMQAAVPYLESNPHVYRYSWFSASAIPSAVLANSDGSPNDLGATYVSLPAACGR